MRETDGLDVELLHRAVVQTRKALELMVELENSLDGSENDAERFLVELLDEVVHKIVELISQHPAIPHLTALAALRAAPGGGAGEQG